MYSGDTTQADKFIATAIVSGYVYYKPAIFNVISRSFLMQVASTDASTDDVDATAHTRSDELWNHADISTLARLKQKPD
jgi:hypothetical protein